MVHHTGVCSAPRFAPPVLVRGLYILLYNRTYFRTVLCRYIPAKVDRYVDFAGAGVTLEIEPRFSVFGLCAAQRCEKKRGSKVRWVR